ncbi:HNH endonuclease signature motif containing protein [Arthrobacter sp. AD-310]
MGISTAGTGMEAICATVAALAALDAEDAALASAGASAVAGDGVDVLQRAYEIRLERLGVTKKLQAQLSALQARDASGAMDLQHAMIPPDAPLHERTYTEMSTVEEIAGILTISSGAASAFVTQSRQVCALPRVVDALSAGTLSWQQARIFADETEALDQPAAAALVEHFLDADAPNPARGCPASELVPARLRAKVRGWRERHHPESIEQRHRKSAADRRVEYTPDRDGMAWISAYLRADQALAISNGLTATARTLQGPNEPRTLTQLKTDVFAARLLSNRTATALDPTAAGSIPTHELDDVIGLATFGGSDEPTAGFNSFDAAPHDSDRPGLAEPVLSGTSTDPDAGRVPRPRAEVLVTVPVFALLGLTDEPAELDGYGPIPASMARELLAGGAESFRRVLLDPRDGTPLEIGRTSYRLAKAMKRTLQLRDGKCVFPGCSNNSLDNDTDHLTAWQHGGTTGISNLAQLCPRHHRLKHNSRWQPTAATKDEPPGWTSPTGRHYTAEQPDRQPPKWPAGMGMPEADQPRAGQGSETGDPDTGFDAGAAAAPWPDPAWPDPAWFESAPPYLEPSGDEPEDENLIDANEFEPDDPVWEAFYAKPFNLPPDPQPDWASLPS